MNSLTGSGGYRRVRSDLTGTMNSMVARCATVAPGTFGGALFALHDRQFLNTGHVAHFEAAIIHVTLGRLGALNGLTKRPTTAPPTLVDEPESAVRP